MIKWMANHIEKKRGYKSRGCVVSSPTHYTPSYVYLSSKSFSASLFVENSGVS